MRKLLATVLAVVMLACVFAALPASAVTFDNSTAADVPDLIATEIMPNPDDGTDYYEFIEFYNNGDTAVNFYDLALVRSPYFKIDSSITQDNPYYSTRNLWAQQKKFQAKVNINEGNLAIPAAADVTLFSGVSFTNPASGTIAPHTFAIIWVVNKNTVNLVNETSLDYGEVPADLPIRLFRERFGLSNDFNVPIFYIWGDKALNDNNTIKTDEFELWDCSNNKYESFMLGLVDKSFELSEAVYSGNTFNTKVKTLFAYGATQVMSYNGASNYRRSFNYVPADQLPVVANRKMKKTDENASDYVKGGYVDSYRQAGMADGLVPDPTPGSMPAYQWYFVDAENAPAAVKTGANWGPEAVQAWADEVAPLGGINQEYNDPDQPVIDVNPPTQEELNEKFFGGGNKSNNKGSSGTKDAGAKSDDAAAEKNNNTLIIILAVVGGVVLIGAAVAVIIVLKKKKAAPAVEEAPAEDAPIEEAPAEAPVEEAPAEEEKKDE